MAASESKQNSTESLFSPRQNDTSPFFGQRLPPGNLSHHLGCWTNVSGTPIYTCFTQNSTSDNQILTSCARMRRSCPLEIAQQCCVNMRLMEVPYTTNMGMQAMVLLGRRERVPAAVRLAARPPAEHVP